MYFVITRWTIIILHAIFLNFEFNIDNYHNKGKETETDMIKHILPNFPQLLPISFIVAKVSVCSTQFWAYSTNISQYVNQL